MKKGAVLLIWDRIGDYHLARVKACEQILDVPLYTANLGSGDKLYKWNNILRENHIDLSVKSVEEKDLLHRFRTFRRLVRKKEINTIAVGYGHIEYVLFLLYARLKGIQTIVFCESWYSRGRFKDFLKSILLKTIGDHYFVSGERAYLHFVAQYKISAKRITQGYSVVDNAHFIAHRTFVERSDIVLCVARFSEEKNLSMLIRSFQASEMSKRYILKIVGAGPLQKELQMLIQDADNILLAPWVAYHQLPALYAEAKIFILPSTFEPWGLVVNEAMAAGLPVLLSEECGCLPDLLEEDINGSSFAASDETALVRILNRWNTYSNEELQQMGKVSAVKIAAFLPEQWAAKIKHMLE